jgi:hypothetical protein
MYKLAQRQKSILESKKEAASADLLEVIEQYDDVRFRQILP